MDAVCFQTSINYIPKRANALKYIFHQSGVGMMASTFALTKLIAEEKPDLLLQVGMAGVMIRLLHWVRLC
jgi:futalosine hydrolase